MSNETRFTPGPWSAEALKNGIEHDIRHDGYFVATAHGGCVDEAENGANAHLIAAAPELYEALEWAMRFVEQVRAESPAPEGGGEDIAYREARAALAKARGES